MYSKVNQLYVHIYLLFLRFFSHRPLQSIEFLVLYSRSGVSLGVMKGVIVFYQTCHLMELLKNSRLLTVQGWVDLEGLEIRSAGS